MSDLPPSLDQLFDTLELLPDRGDRIQFLIDLAERFQSVPEHVARSPFPEDRKVPACESDAYLWAVPRDDGTLDYHFAVENPQGISAKAMAVILGDACSGVELERVARVPDDVVYTIFGRELSMGKTLGLTGMVAMVRASAKKALA